MRSLPIAAILLISAGAAFAQGTPGAQLGAPEKVVEAKPNAETTPPDVIAPSGGGALPEVQATVPIGTAIAATPTSIDSGVTVGMQVKSSAGGQAIGTIIDVARSQTGQVYGAVVQLVDGAERIIPRSDLNMQGGAAVTSRSVGEIMSMRGPR